MAYQYGYGDDSKNLNPPSQSKTETDEASGSKSWPNDTAVGRNPIDAWPSSSSGKEQATSQYCPACACGGPAFELNKSFKELLDAINDCACNVKYNENVQAQRNIELDQVKIYIDQYKLNQITKDQLLHLISPYKFVREALPDNFH